MRGITLEEAAAEATEPEVGALMDMEEPDMVSLPSLYLPTSWKYQRPASTNNEIAFSNQQLDPMLHIPLILGDVWCLPRMMVTTADVSFL